MNDAARRCEAHDSSTRKKAGDLAAHVSHTGRTPSTKVAGSSYRFLDRLYSYRNPLARIQLASTFGHSDNAVSFIGIPAPWAPSLKMCISAGHAGFPQSEEVVDAVFCGHGCVGVGVEQERRRRLRRDARVRRKPTRERRVGLFAEQHGLRSLMRPCLRQRDHGIPEDREIGPAAGAIDRHRVGVALPRSNCVERVDARCPPAEKPMTPMRSGARCHSAARDRSSANRALHVAELDRMAVFRSEPVLQHERRDAKRVQDNSPECALPCSSTTSDSRRLARRSPPSSAQSCSAACRS